MWTHQMNAVNSQEDLEDINMYYSTPEMWTHQMNAVNSQEDLEDINMY